MLAVPTVPTLFLSRYKSSNRAATTTEVFHRHELHCTDFYTSQFSRRQQEELLWGSLLALSKNHYLFSLLLVSLEQSATETIVHTPPATPSQSTSVVSPRTIVQPVVATLLHLLPSVERTKQLILQETLICALRFILIPACVLAPLHVLASTLALL